MSSENQPNQKIVALFSDQPCWQLETLAKHLKYSTRSIQRYLGKVGYHRSFTHNGKWYTLHRIPVFNHDGLWFSDNIGFSKAGNLNNTLIKLTTNSFAGLTAEALGKKLHTRCHTLLVQLYRREKLQREKVGRSYVYLAADPHIAESQRQALAGQNLPVASVPSEIALWVFVEFIQNPQASFEQLATILKNNRQIIITARQIQRVFNQYGVKKTPPTVAQGPSGP
jgi:predicted transcriptional regulator